MSKGPTQVIMLICLSLFVGCSTTRHKEFAQVKPGMDKQAVLEFAGNPDRTMRYQGKDRWIYDFRLDDYSTDSQEVHFQEGRVVYIGKAIQPTVSAAEQDDLNESSNRAASALRSNETLLEVRNAPAVEPAAADSSASKKAVWEKVQ
jgi:outer membrane protein assembly factor BamE (lipoprotein component of BamABCDE complex)